MMEGRNMKNIFQCQYGGQSNTANMRNYYRDPSGNSINYIWEPLEYSQNKDKLLHMLLEALVSTIHFVKFEVCEVTYITANLENSAVSRLLPFVYFESSCCKIEAKLADKSEELTTLELTSWGISGIVSTT